MLVCHFSQSLGSFKHLIASTQYIFLDLDTTYIRSRSLISCIDDLDMASFESGVLTRAGKIHAERHPDCDNMMKQGIASVFRQWTALELAIFHQWGGPKPEEVIAEMEQELMAMFTGPEKIYKDDVAFILEDYMEAHFNTMLEDGSPDEIGELLCDMWRKCCVGDFEAVNIVKTKERMRPSITGQCQGLEGGDVIDSDDENDGLAIGDVMQTLREEGKRIWRQRKTKLKRLP